MNACTASWPAPRQAESQSKNIYSPFALNASHSPNQMPAFIGPTLRSVMPRGHSPFPQQNFVLARIGPPVPRSLQIWLTIHLDQSPITPPKLFPPPITSTESATYTPDCFANFAISHASAPQTTSGFVPLLFPSGRSLVQTHPLNNHTFQRTANYPNFAPSASRNPHPFSNLQRSLFCQKTSTPPKLASFHHFPYRPASNAKLKFPHAD